MNKKTNLKTMLKQKYLDISLIAVFVNPGLGMGRKTGFIQS